MTSLTDEQEDVLRELFNIGIGRAAKALSDLVQQRVELSIPTVQLLSSRDAANAFGTESVRAIEQRIRGPLNGRCALIFPSNGGLDVVRAMVGANMPAEMVLELQDEAFSELGNIIINACVGAISRTIDETICVSIPSFRECDPRSLIGEPDNQGHLLLVLQVEMKLDVSDMDGYLAFILDSSALKDFENLVIRMLEPVNTRAG